MMKYSLLLFLASTFLLSTTSMAYIKPIRLASDRRIEVVSYSPYNVVPTEGTTFTTTQITFGKNEFIEDVQNGDLGAWTASINKDLPNMLFVKPTAYDSHTNMTVVTNKHTYYFQMTSNKRIEQVDKKATYAIHFLYPQEQQRKVQKALLVQEQQKKAEVSALAKPTDYNWHYSFHGDRHIMPIHVFDDKQFTYLQLRPNQPIPAIFAVTSRNGEEFVVNYRIDGQYLVIQRVAPQFTLRDGKHHVATIFNDSLIRKMRSQNRNA